MVGSAGSSEPQSVGTSEMGMGEVVNEAPPRQRRRCVVPSVRPRPRHGSDQLVPVYWDQTVPVWCEEVGPPSTKRRRQQQDNSDSSSSLRRFGGAGSAAGGSASTMFTVENSNNTTSCSEELAGAPQVSFDVITSMYRSSLVEVCYKRCSLRGNQEWVLGALLLQQQPKKKKRIIMRQRSTTFAGRCTSRTELAKSNLDRSISLLTGASVDHGTLSRSSNSQCRMNQLQHGHRDPNLYTSSMLTTSSSH